MIETIGLCKNFGRTQALLNINFKVNDAEVFGLLGANGAGKTTMLRILATMLKPSTGTAMVGGFDAVKEPQRVRERIGLLFGGDTGLYDRLTARENILYFAELSDMKKDVANKRIEELAEMLNFTEYLDVAAGKLSKGTRQKAAFSRAIVHDPSIMLFDEPMQGLDVTSKKEVTDFILHCKAQGKLIIVSDHALELIESLCDRVGILNKGELKCVGTVNELTAAYGQKNLNDVFFNLVGEDSKDEKRLDRSKKRNDRHNPR